MPVTVIYLENHGEHKKSDRGRLLAPAFLRLRRQGVVKRVMTTDEDLKLSVENTNVEKKPKRGTNPNSLKNLKKNKK